MAGIPLNLALVNGAQPFPLSGQVQAIPVNTCNIPQEGPRAIPIQVGFANAAAQLIDMSAGIPPVSQIVMMYVDATASVDQVLIIFPDTGYTVPINAGKSLLFPVFTSSANLPKFYAVINTNGVVSASDLVNIILFNFFLPEFAAG